MKEKGKLWIAKATVIVFLLVMLGRLMSGSAAAWSAVRAMFYFCVIFSGYRWGIAGGAVGGCLCGLAEVLRVGELAGLGLMCVMGVLAGCFRRLGKGGSVLAFLCGAFGLGFVYAETYFLVVIPELLVAGTLFLLLPVDAMAVRPDKETAAGGLEGLQRQRLEETAESYGKLARSMGAIPQTVGDNIDAEWDEVSGREAENDVVWKDRFFESREAVSLQFREMERTLKEMAAQLDQAVDMTPMFEKQIRNNLRRHRLQLKQLLVVEGEGARQEAYVTVCSGGTGCITAREVSDSVGKTLERSLRPADGGRTVVGKEPCTIRLVEETKFRLLSGLAKECKDTEDLSGDNFSCHELPDGRTMLCLSDGMGSGRQAFLESQLVTELLEELLDTGFTAERAIYMVNALLLIREEQAPATLDLALVDLYTGQACFFKQGAVGTFIRRGHQVIQIRPGALPIGIECDAAPAFAQAQLEDGDMVVMLTDGVLDAMEGEDKEADFCEYLSHTTKTNARELADEVLALALKGQGGSARDDMTVLTAGIWKK